MNIRNMTIEDAEDVAALGQLTPELAVSEESRFWSIPRLQKWIENGKDVMLVAEENGQIIGAQLTQLHYPSSIGLLSDLFVHKDKRHSGIGHALHTEAICRMKKLGMTYIYALTQDSNHAIHKFLEKEGFSKGDNLIWYELKP